MESKKIGEYSGLSRREFIAGGAAAGAAFMIMKPSSVFGAEANSKIEIGVVGLGGRGAWIAGLFNQHGGYKITAVADYFQEVAEKNGQGLGVDKARCFSGLSGYKKLIDSKVDAIVLETPPYFMPDHAKAAVEAGFNVYMAKPVAVDVPGALQVEAAGKLATEKKKTFMVDYQIPTDPVNIEVAKRISEGGLGKIQQVFTVGTCGGFADPPLTENIESRLRGLIWVNDIALGCDYIGNFDIHAIDGAIWALGQRPIVASGASRIGREEPHGDARDVCSVIYEYADGIVHNHYGQGLGNNIDGELSCRLHGPKANAMINYWGKAYLRGGPKHYGGGQVENLYEVGAKRNIAAFHEDVTKVQFANITAKRAVDGVLTCILGREAAARHTRLTMEALIKENKKLEVSFKGLKS